MMPARTSEVQMARMIVRLPEHIYEALKREAALNKRSLNREVVSMLSEGRQISEPVDDRRIIARIEELIERTAERRASATGAFNRNAFETLYKMVEKGFDGSKQNRSGLEVVRLTCDAYVALSELVADMTSEEEVQAYLPAVEFRMKSRVR